MDADSSQSISAQEFRTAWDELTEVLLEEQAASFGLSQRHIMLAILWIIVTLCLLFLFIFFALAGWQNDASFDAVVRSLMIGGVGTATTALRKRSAAELAASDAGGLEGLAKSAMLRIEDEAGD